MVQTISSVRAADRRSRAGRVVSADRSDRPLM
jgi:hypothetical protein